MSAGRTFWVNGVDHGSVVLVLEIVVAFRVMDRRVRCYHVAAEVGELGLITCVWGWVSHSADGQFGVLDEAPLDFTGGRRVRKARSSCCTSSTIALRDSQACLALEAASASQACEDIAA